MSRSTHTSKQSCRRTAERRDLLHPLLTSLRRAQSTAWNRRKCLNDGVRYFPFLQYAFAQHAIGASHDFQGCLCFAVAIRHQHRNILVQCVIVRGNQHLADILEQRRHRRFFRILEMAAPRQFARKDAGAQCMRQFQPNALTTFAGHAFD